MPYPEIPNYRQLIDHLTLYAQLKHEYGAEGIPQVLAEAEAALNRALDTLKAKATDATTIETRTIE